VAVYTDYEELVSYVMCLVDFQVTYSGLEPISWIFNQTWSFGSISLFSTKCVGSLWTVSNVALQHPEIYTGQSLHTYLPQEPTLQKPYCIFIFLQSSISQIPGSKKQRYGKMNDTYKQYHTCLHQSCSVSQIQIQSDTGPTGMGGRKKKRITIG